MYNSTKVRIYFSSSESTTNNYNWSKQCIWSEFWKLWEARGYQQLEKRTLHIILRPHLYINDIWYSRRIIFNRDWNSISFEIQSVEGTDNYTRLDFVLSQGSRLLHRKLNIFAQISENRIKLNCIAAAVSNNYLSFIIHKGNRAARNSRKLFYLLLTDFCIYYFIGEDSLCFWDYLVWMILKIYRN